MIAARFFIGNRLKQDQSTYRHEVSHSVLSRLIDSTLGGDDRPDCRSERPNRLPGVFVLSQRRDALWVSAGAVYSCGNGWYKHPAVHLDVPLARHQIAAARSQLD